MTMAENTLVKCMFLELLEREFQLHLEEQDTEKIDLARQSIEIYDAVEAFYKATGWRWDNPEEAETEYLLEHKILALVQGKLLYFSRLRYEDGLKKLEG